MLDEALRRNAQPMRDLIQAKHQLHKLHHPAASYQSAAAAATVMAATASVPAAPAAVTTATAVVPQVGGAPMAPSVTVLASVRVSRRYVFCLSLPPLPLSVCLLELCPVAGLYPHDACPFISRLMLFRAPCSQSIAQACSLSPAARAFSSSLCQPLSSTCTHRLLSSPSL